MTDNNADGARQGPRRSRDQRIADEAHADLSLLCGATGCPNRWSVDAGNGRLCSAHAWVGRHLWPQITHEQQDAETDRARAAVDAPVEDMPATRDPARLAAALAKLAQQKDSLAWAKRLQWCEGRRAGKLPSGQRMTEFQRWAWRHALRYRPESSGEVDAEAPRAHALPGPAFPATNDTEASHVG